MKHYNVPMKNTDNINNDGDDDETDELDNIILFFF